MARIDFDRVDESTGAGAVPNGTYVLKVTRCDFGDGGTGRNRFGDANSLTLEFDVAEGPHEGGLADRPGFARSLDLRFDKALGVLKHNLMCISRSNPGFDALAAYNAATDVSDPAHARAISAFAGKVFGASLVTYHRPKADGTDGTTYRAWALYDADEARGGREKGGRPIAVLPDQWRAGWTAEAAEAARAQAAPAPAPSDDDAAIPF